MGSSLKDSAALCRWQHTGVKMTKIWRQCNFFFFYLESSSWSTQIWILSPLGHWWLDLLKTSQLWLEMTAYRETVDTAWKTWGGKKERKNIHEQVNRKGKRGERRWKSIGKDAYICQNFLLYSLEYNNTAFHKRVYFELAHMGSGMLRCQWHAN